MHAEDLLRFTVYLLVGAALTLGLVAGLDWAVRNAAAHDLGLFDTSVAHLGIVATTALFFLSRSFVDYWLHRAFHTPVLWPLHRLHHSATRLTLATAVRGHPAGQFLAPVASALPLLLWEAPAWFVLAFFAAHTYHEILVHSHADIDWGWIARWVQCAPVNHKLHHSLDPRHPGRNYSTNLPLWDHLFGTFAHERHIAAVGLPAPDRERSLAAQLLVDLDDTRRAAAEVLRSAIARDEVCAKG
jgi:sterol desaturase/sphingolipid hydroxylase (fatty acid hydroxylase superfamily)